jgi:uncharacterized protein (TIGR00251 family)
VKISLAVKPQSRQDKIEKLDESHFKVWVKAPAQDGRANEAVIRLMADYLKVPKSRLEILRGETSKNKIMRVR